LYLIEPTEGGIEEATLKVCDAVLPKDFEGKKIVIKPNAVYPHSPETGTTTNPKVIDGILKYLLNYVEAKNILIAEAGDCLENDHIWLDRYIKPLVNKYGCGYSSIRELKKVKAPIFPPTVVPEFFLDEKVIIINVPKLKAHYQTWTTCAIKNFVGCFFPRYVIHRGSLNKNLEILGKYLSTRKGIYTIVDATKIATFTHICGIPMDMNLIFGSDSLVTADSIGANLLGVVPTYFQMGVINDPLIDSRKIKAEVFGRGFFFDKS